MQPSLSPVPSSVDVSVFRSLSVWKVIVVMAVFCATAFFVGFTLTSFLPDDGVMNVSAAIPLLVALVIFLVAADIAVIVLRRGDIIAGSMVLAALFLMIGLLPSHISLILVLAFVAAALSFLWGGFVGRRVADRLLTLHVTVISRSIGSKMMIGISLFIALVFFNVFSFAPLGVNNPIVPQAWFESAAESFSRVLAPIVGQVDLSLSLRDLAQSSVESSLQRAGLTPSSALVNDLVEKTVNDAQTRIVKIVGQPIDDSRPLSTALYGVLLDKFNSLDQPIQRVILGGFAFVLFLSVQMLSPLIRGVVGIISSGVFTILKVSGFVSVLNQERQQEVVVLS